MDSKYYITLLYIFKIVKINNKNTKNYKAEFKFSNNNFDVR